MTSASSANAAPAAAEPPRVARLPLNLLDALKGAGVDAAALVQRLGLPAGSLESGMTFIEADRFLCAAWEAAADPCMGLVAGSQVRPERFGVVGIAAMSSPDFGTAVQRKARYWRLIWGDAYDVRLRGREAAAVLSPLGPVRPYTQAKVDMELASLVAFGRRFTGVHIAPLRLTLRQAAPAWHRRYEEMFGCPVMFGEADNALVFARKDFDLPLLSRNAEVSDLMGQGVEAALARAGSDTSALRAEVGLAIDRMLQGDEPTLTEVARRLHRSERTLQRQLAKEDIRFTDVLDERRHEAARRFLGDPMTTVEEVAFLLGFSTPSSFFRAFKRWTGKTPKEWRSAVDPGSSPG